MIDGASVKRGLLERFETETSPILRSNFDRPLPRLQKTAWRRLSFTGVVRV